MPEPPAGLLSSALRLWPRFGVPRMVPDMAEDRDAETRQAIRVVLWWTERAVLLLLQSSVEGRGGQA